MVTPTGGKNGARSLRALNRPRLVRVQVNGDGIPAKVVSSGRILIVHAVADRWVVDTDWWREKPARRNYFSLLAADGEEITVYQDVQTGEWYAQRA